MKILVDAFGGDNSPSEVIIGVVQAVNEREGFTVALVGNEDVINARLSEHVYDKDRISVINATEVITCEEEPTVAIRKKPNSSLCVAFKELKENADASALISAGSTGAVLVGATLKVGRFQGISRPALCPILPTFNDKNVLLLDSGANADCKAQNLHDFAILGNEYCKTVLGIKNPRIALLSNGTEDEKGNALNHEVFPMLKEDKTLNFIGNMEARDILSGDADVVVTDGFSGNIALKSIEGSVVGLMKLIKNEIYSSFKAKLGGMLIKKNMKRIKAKMDYQKGGGALFLGVKKLIIKAHGSSTAETFKNCVFQAVDVSSRGVVDALAEVFSKTEGNA